MAGAGGGLVNSVMVKGRRLGLSRGVMAQLKENESGRLLTQHVKRLLACSLCQEMHKPVVSGGAVLSKVMLVGQAPGDKEPVLGRPFAWTAGKTLFRWFNEAAGMSEEAFRSSIYMAAVCRCFPGKKATGGDRVPTPDEIQKCSSWMKREVEILKPKLVIPVGKLAIEQFIPPQKLDVMIGKKFVVKYAGQEFDLVPLPHPSGASPWHRMEPGKTLLKGALRLIAAHPAFQELL
ncbi:MAG: Uracil-DNA glycosylase superfamily [Pedosphaera sp.]|nr:Uracil-DNA glycosylase superfamily [Pedosphaera sp.]